MAVKKNILSLLKAGILGYLLIASLLLFADLLFYEQWRLQKAISDAHAANSAYQYSQLERDLLKAALECQRGALGKERLISIRRRSKLACESDDFVWLDRDSQRVLRDLASSVAGGSLRAWDCGRYLAWADKIHPVVVEAADNSNRTRGKLVWMLRNFQRDTSLSFALVLIIMLIFVWSQWRASRRQKTRIADLESEGEFKSRLLGMVAHELRTPVATIMGFSELLSDDAARRQEYAGRIRRAARRLNQTLTSFLDMHQMQQGRTPKLQKEELRLDELVTEAIEMAEGRYPRVPFSLQTAEDVRVEADETKIFSVVLNLLSNAAKYGPEGSEVNVRVRCQEGWAVAEVQDAGRPLNPEEVRAVFEPWARLRRHRSLEGYGLGLAVVREIVRQHGGELGWRVEDGGQVFWFRLPCAG